MSSSVVVALINKELRQILRGRAALALQVGYLLLAGGIAAVVLESAGESGQAGWVVGAGAFWAIVYTQAVLAVLIGTTLTAASVSSEHEQKTFDTLASTPLLMGQVVGGKVLAGFAVGATIMVMSAPVAAVCLLLGGVPLSTALWAYLLTFAALLLATAIGLCSSVVTRRTIGAMPLAVGVSLLLLLVVSSLESLSGGLSALSPVWAIKLLAYEGSVRLFGADLPVWLITLVGWALLAAAVLQGAVDNLKAPPLRRLWLVRVAFAMLFLLVVALVLGALQVVPGEPCRDCATAGETVTRDAAATTVSGLLTFVTYAILIMTAVFAAGSPTPLDRRRQEGQSLQAYSLPERAFGYSRQAGARYVLLLTVLGFAVTVLGLLLWGPQARLWLGPTAMALAPALAAVWAFSIVSRLVSAGRWPRTNGGRHFLALVVVIVLMLAPLLPALFDAGAQEPSALAELAFALMPAGGVFGAFPTEDAPYASAFMVKLQQTVPIPLVTTLWHLLLGGLALLAGRLITRRRAMVMSDPADQ